MNKFAIGCAGVLLVVFLAVCLVLSTCVGYYNTDKQLYNKEAVQQNLVEGVHSKMVTTIAQQAQIVHASKEFQLDVTRELVEGRKDGFIRLIREENPNYTVEQYMKLMNSVQGLRDEFFRVQKEYQSIVQQHQNLYDQFPSSLILSVVGKGRPELPVMVSDSTTRQVITSGEETKESLQLEL